LEIQNNPIPKYFSLAEAPEDRQLRINSIQEDEYTEKILRDIWDQGLLPGSRVLILKKFLSQDKLLIQINSSIQLAVPEKIAQRILVSYE
jgi:Fe2+ transport system protein FeoA